MQKNKKITVKYAVFRHENEILFEIGLVTLRDLWYTNL